MTFCVVANTIVLALDHYGISESMLEILTLLNDIFTYIFIAEMGLKLIGIGVIDYCRDSMNYLDGLVVILSIV